MARKNRVPVTQFRETWLWLSGEEKLYAKLLRGFHPILHLFCGTSNLGDVRVDREDFPNVTHRMEIKPDRTFRLPFKDNSFEATIFDPPWINNFFTWAAREVPRVTRKRIIAVTGSFWYGPAKPYCYAWSQPKIYVVKGISPVCKLVFVYDRENTTLDDFQSNFRQGYVHPKNVCACKHVKREAELRRLEKKRDLRLFS